MTFAILGLTSSGNTCRRVFFLVISAPPSTVLGLCFWFGGEEKVLDGGPESRSMEMVWGWRLFFMVNMLFLMSEGSTPSKRSLNCLYMSLHDLSKFSLISS